MLAEPDLVHYLLRRELIGTASIVDGDLTIVDASRRNHNFGILRDHGPSYLLKQGIDLERSASVSNEARIYQFFHSAAERDGFTGYLPRYFGYDPDEHVLLLEFLGDVEDLREYHARCGRFSTKIAEAVGDALSLLHRKNWVSLEGGGDAPVCRPPCMLSIHRPDLEILGSISGTNLQVIRIIQQDPEFCDLLDELHQSWKTVALIHGDFKWENCLVSAPAKNKTLKIIDWELGGLGDPAWDVGSVFATYLSYWLAFVPVTTATEPRQSLRLARYPLEKMQPALRSFWRSYVARMQLDLMAAEQQLVLAIKYGAARLAQTAYEQMHSSPQLLGNAVCSLQVSLNILKNPRNAGTTLLGIPPLSN